MHRNLVIEFRVFRLNALQDRKDSHCRDFKVLNYLVVQEWAFTMRDKFRQIGSVCYAVSFRHTCLP